MWTHVARPSAPLGRDRDRISAWDVPRSFPDPYRVRVGRHMDVSTYTRLWGMSMPFELPRRLVHMFIYLCIHLYVVVLFPSNQPHLAGLM
jgi:hypothetical protein